MAVIATKRKKKLKRPVFARLELLVRPETGESVAALVAHMPVDKRAFRALGLRLNDTVAIDVRKDRNPYFWRKAHVLGEWLAHHVERFSGLDQHAAVKKLQELSGIGCTVVEYDLTGIGKLTRTEPEHLDFTSMDETRFVLLWDGGPEANNEGGWIGWLRVNAWPELPPMQRDEVEELIRRQDQ